MIKLVAVVTVALVVSFLCSVLEAVLLSISHSHVAILQGRGDRVGKVLEGMKRRIDEPIAAILTLNTIAHTVGATMAGAIAAGLFGEVWIGVFSAALTFAVLVFSEIIPKTLGATFWRQLARPTAHLLRVMVFVMKPALVPLGLLSRWIGPSHGDTATVSRAEIAAVAEIGRRDGAIDEDEFQVMSKVMRLDDITVGEIMTPRIDIVAVPADATIRKATDIMLDRGKLRLPVYEDNLDQVAGIVVARDLWRAAREGSDSLLAVVRPAQFSPASQPVEDLFRSMRAQGTKMAIVVDEFGGTAGLVTLEDMIEEIVGEIRDEHDIDEPREFQALPQNRTLIWGGASVKDVEERLDIHLNDDFDTLGGYVFGRLNRVGQVGDTVECDGGQLRIVKMQQRRIEYVVFEPGGAGEIPT